MTEQAIPMEVEDEAAATDFASVAAEKNNLKRPMEDSVEPFHCSEAKKGRHV